MTVIESVPAATAGGIVASALRDTKAALVAAPGAGIVQTGAVSIGDPIVLPVAPFEVHEAMIETFVVDGATCTPMETEPRLSDLFAETAAVFATRVDSHLDRLGIHAPAPRYLTASLTPASLVFGHAHLDDDQFHPDAGPGLVAIVGNCGGPRIATGVAPLVVPAPGLPVALAPVAEDVFDAGTFPHQVAAADQPVLFPQFGQVHAGPPLAATSPTGTRSLLVLRGATTPIPASEGT